MENTREAQISIHQLTSKETKLSNLLYQYHEF